MRNVRNLDLNLLRNLNALLEKKHVAQAADLLTITPSAVSHSLRRLREYFDDSLLVRRDNRYELTPLAQELQEKLQVFMRDVEGIVSTGEFEPSQIDMVFKIEAYDFITVDALAPAIKKMLKLAPKLVIEVDSFTSKSLDKLLHNEIDLLLGNEMLPNTSLMNRNVREERIMCILDENHPALKNWSPEALFAYPHIVHSDPAEIDKLGPVRKYCTKHGYKRIVGLRTRNPHIRPTFVRGTELIDMQLESQALLTSRIPGLKIMPFPSDVPPLKINMIWTERNHKDKVHSWIREQLS